MAHDDSNANHRITNLMERLAIGVLVILLGFVQTQYWADKAEAKQEVKDINTKVLDLYRSSVTKQELKELETRLTANVEGIRSDIRQILTLYVEKR
jgi:hypothetical protein